MKVLILPAGRPHSVDPTTDIYGPREIATDMQRISDRCPNPECENSLGGSFQKAQFEKLEEGVWECRQCGLVRDL
ncbi:hypothetical protein BRC99_01750 [Halobacteriales archaeon QS_7_69_60]|nr:MAG: hypothetical protein BRC99_01750 [Halobacteriales archaeon QS_7_69_60]